MIRRTHLLILFLVTLVLAQSYPRLYVSRKTAANSPALLYDYDSVPKSMDSAQARSIVHDSADALRAHTLARIADTATVLRARLADTSSALRAALTDPAEVRAIVSDTATSVRTYARSRISDSLTANVRAWTTLSSARSAISDSMRAERTFDTATARLVARDTATVLRARLADTSSALRAALTDPSEVRSIVHDSADALRAHTLARIADTATVLRARLADTSSALRAALTDPAEVRAIVSDTATSVRTYARSRISDSLTANVRAWTTLSSARSAISDSMRAERTFDTATARLVARDTATVLRARLADTSSALRAALTDPSEVRSIVHDSADALRAHTLARIADTATVLRARLADTSSALRAALTDPAEVRAIVSDTATSVRTYARSRISDSLTANVRAWTTLSSARSAISDSMRAERTFDTATARLVARDTATVLRARLADTSSALRAALTDPSEVRSIVHDSADALRAHTLARIADTATALRARLADTSSALRAALTDPAEVRAIVSDTATSVRTYARSRISDSLTANVRAWTTLSSARSAISDSMRAERTFDTATARLVARDTATVLRARLADTSSTLRSLVATREPTISAGTTAQYWRGDKSWQALPTTLPPNGVAGGDLTGSYPNPTLAAVGTAGTYRSVTTDSKGRVTAGTNPTTLSGYGITDAQPLDADLTSIAALSTTAYGRSLLVQADASAARAALGAQATLTSPVTGSAAAGQVALWSGTTTQSGSAHLTLSGAALTVGDGSTDAYTILQAPSGGRAYSLYRTGSTNRFLAAWDASTDALTYDSRNDDGSSRNEALRIPRSNTSPVVAGGAAGQAWSFTGPVSMAAVGNLVPGSLSGGISSYSIGSSSAKWQQGWYYSTWHDYAYVGALTVTSEATISALSATLNTPPVLSGTSIIAVASGATVTLPTGYAAGSMVLVASDAGTTLRSQGYITPGTGEALRYIDGNGAQIAVPSGSTLPVGARSIWLHKISATLWRVVGIYE